MKYLIIACLLIVNQHAYTQAESGMESGIFRLERGTFDSHQNMIGRKIPPAEAKGDYYLDSEWHQGTFTLKYGRSSAEYPLRYDVENAVLEIQWGNMVKVAGEEYLASFRWSDEEGEKLFLNAGEFAYKGTALAGFVELVYQGEDSLLLKTDAYLKQADYVEGLDMGSRHPEIIMNQKFLVVHEGEAFDINRRKDFLNYADDVPAKVLKRYIQKENINLKEASDLSVLMGYYESLKNKRK